jgi:hypothetical protein
MTSLVPNIYIVSASFGHLHGEVVYVKLQGLIPGFQLVNITLDGLDTSIYSWKVSFNKISFQKPVLGTHHGGPPELQLSP